MAVLGRLLVSSAERLDLPDFLSIDSYTQGDFKYLLKSFVGDDKPFVLKGFDVINPGNAIGTQNISVRVADSVVYYPGSLAGPYFHGLEEGNIQAAPLVPELRKNATNYVYLTLTTTEAANDTRAFWDPDKEGGEGGEFTQDVNTQTVLSVDINVSVSSFPENTVPVCKVVVGANFIESIEDARDMMFRLGSGGLNPNPLTRYDWREEPGADYDRLEPNTLMSNALDPNPFFGGDKNIQTLKEWMDAVMTKLAELGGTTYWYEDTSVFNVINVFKDALATSIKSKGYWNSSTITPGLLSWSEDIHVQSTRDLTEVIVRDGSTSLDNNQVMYIDRVRDAAINSGSVSVQWFNSVDYVNGTLGSFENLSKGDWIKKADDTDDKYLRVEEFYASASLGGGVTAPGNALSIKLSDNYQGVSESKQAVYIKGIYLDSEVSVADRNDPAVAEASGNFFWMAMRSDTTLNVSDITTTTLSLDIEDHDGTRAKVTSIAHGLSDGQRIGIAGSTNFDGTYPVSVEDVDTFYIELIAGPHADELGVSGYYATITTAARDNGNGLELESANHGLERDQIVQISDTTNYNNSYQAYPTSNNTFTVPLSVGVVNETEGTATIVNIYVRTDIGPTKIEQGENKYIGEVETENLMNFIGMDNDSQTHPSYYVTGDYNTINGYENYNSNSDDNLTQRVSKLTSMMADRSQEKMIQFNATDCDVLVNTTNGTAQELIVTSLLSNLPTLNISLPASDNSGVALLNTTISLQVNQAAYIQIDRNAGFNIAAPSIADIDNVPLGENIFIIASRLSGTDVFLWDATLVPADESVEYSKHARTVIRQNQNLKLIAGGNWSWDLALTELVLDSDAYIQVPGLANTRNTIDAQTITLANDGDVAYVDINRNTGIAASLTVNISAASSLSQPNPNRIIIARRVGDEILLSGIKLIDGQVSQLDELTTLATLTFIGATDVTDSDPEYSSVEIITQGSSLVDSISDLDAATAASGDRSNQDRVTKLVAGGTWSWDLLSNELTLSADAYLQIAGITKESNTISAQTITLANADEVAYVDINRIDGVSVLTVNVADEASVVLGDNTFVIARRIGDEVLVGRSFQLKDKEFLELDGALAEINRYFGQLRLIPHETNAQQVRITGADITKLSNSKIKLSIRNLLLSFSGAVIDFSTGEIFESDGVTAFLGGANDFTPATIGSTEYFWYSVNLLASTVNPNNEITGQLLVLSSSGSDAVLDDAPRAAFANGVSLGQVYVQEDGAGSIEDINYENIVQLGVGGSGSGGTGDANELLERLKNRLQSGTFEYMTPVIFSSTEDDLVDPSSTATYSIVDSNFEFENIGDELVSVQMLDDEFLSAGIPLKDIELVNYWNSDNLDTGATYEVSRDGGNSWQTISMTRIGQSDTYRGVHEFTTEVFNVYQQSIGGISAGTTPFTDAGNLSRQFTLANTSTIRNISAEITVTGTPIGFIVAQVVKDDGLGSPSTLVEDIVGQSGFIDIGSLASGTLDFNLEFTAPAGDYHVIFKTDAVYKNDYVSSVGANSIAIDNDGSDIIYDIEGIELDLRVRITSSIAEVQIEGFGVFYKSDETITLTDGNILRDTAQFVGDVDNLSTFTLNFLPDPRLLNVYELGTGQVYRYGAFILDGSQVIFEPGTFNKPETVNLEFLQVAGGSFDNNPENKALLAANHLGSSDPNIDMSVAGRGIFLRRPDGTLREIGIDDDDNLTIYSI